MNRQRKLFVAQAKIALGLVVVLLAAVLTASVSADGQEGIKLAPIGTFATGVFDEGVAEIVAHDPATQRLFIINGFAGVIDVLDISDPTSPSFLFAIDVSSYGAKANSVAARDGVIAAAVENVNKQAPGAVVFFDANGGFLSSVTAGALPDMITFSPNGRKVLVANEGEPNDAYTVDPEGSITIVDVSAGVANVTQADVCTAGFSAFNSAALDSRIRVYGPGATVAQDMEPEFVTVSHDSMTAWVALQENNALAIVDIDKCEVEELVALGTKDHSLSGNGFDASNKDGMINIANWPTNGMYQPDAIASYQFQDETFIITANEGDSRDYVGFSEEVRIKDLVLDPTAFPNAADLQLASNLGRLKTTTVNGDTDGDGDFDELFSYGARSFSIWSAEGDLVFDSGDQIEQITAAVFPSDFNSTNDENGSFDDRSDDKGSEPEGVVVGRVSGHTYAFIGLERIGGVMVYDVSDPSSPSFVQYVNTRDFAGDAVAGTAGDLGPEGLIFIKEEDSPNGKPLLVVANEVSGSTTIFEITRG